LIRQAAVVDPPCLRPPRGWQEDAEAFEVSARERLFPSRLRGHERCRGCPPAPTSTRDLHGRIRHGWRRRWYPRETASPGFRARDGAPPDVVVPRRHVHWNPDIPPNLPQPGSSAPIAARSAAFPIRSGCAGPWRLHGCRYMKSVVG